MRVDTLQLVHDGADVLHAVAHFNTHCLLDARTQGMAILMSAQIIKAVGQCQRLRVGKAFAHLFDTPVDVSTVGIYLINGFTLQ